MKTKSGNFNQSGNFKESRNLKQKQKTEEKNSFYIQREHFNISQNKINQINYISKLDLNSLPGSFIVALLLLGTMQQLGLVGAQNVQQSYSNGLQEKDRTNQLRINQPKFNDIVLSNDVLNSALESGLLIGSELKNIQSIQPIQEHFAGKLIKGDKQFALNATNHIQGFLRKIEEDKKLDNQTKLQNGTAIINRNEENGKSCRLFAEQIINDYNSFFAKELSDADKKSKYQTIIYDYCATCAEQLEIKAGEKDINFKLLTEYFERYNRDSVAFIVLEDLLQYYKDPNHAAKINKIINSGEEIKIPQDYTDKQLCDGFEMVISGTKGVQDIKDQGFTRHYQRYISESGLKDIGLEKLKEFQDKVKENKGNLIKTLEDHGFKNFGILFNDYQFELRDGQEKNQTNRDNQTNWNNNGDNQTQNDSNKNLAIILSSLIVIGGVVYCTIKKCSDKSIDQQNEEGQVQNNQGGIKQGGNERELKIFKKKGPNDSSVINPNDQGRIEGENDQGEDEQESKSFFPSGDIQEVSSTKSLRGNDKQNC
jgi:hypothetical protein